MICLGFKEVVAQRHRLRGQDRQVVAEDEEDAFDTW